MDDERQQGHVERRWHTAAVRSLQAVDGVTQFLLTFRHDQMPKISTRSRSQCGETGVVHMRTAEARAGMEDSLPALPATQCTIPV